MPRSALRLVTICALASLVLLSCKKQPPKVPEPEPEPVAAAPEPPKPPPPPPKCEAFDEKCVATADTKLVVGDGVANFQAPEGWTYAKTQNGSVAKTEDGTAAVGFRVIADGLDPKGNPDGVAAALAPLLEQMGVTDATDKEISKRVKKAPVQEAAGGLALETWDLAAKVAGENGMLLIIVTKVSGQALIGTVAMRKAVMAQHGQAAREAYLSLRSGQ